MASTLQNNSISLQEVLETIKSLPMAVPPEDLDDVFAEQNALLTSLDGVLTSRQSTDSNECIIDTCTVWIEDTRPGLFGGIVYTTYSDGKISTSNSYIMDEMVSICDLYVRKAVCGSLLQVKLDEFSSISCTGARLINSIIHDYDENTSVGYALFEITASAGQMVRITLE